MMTLFMKMKMMMEMMLMKKMCDEQHDVLCTHSPAKHHDDDGDDADEEDV